MRSAPGSAIASSILWGAGLRFGLAAALLVVVMALLRLELPRRRALTGCLLYGALNFGAAFALIDYGLVRVHAGLGQTLLAVVPLATLLLAGSIVSACLSGRSAPRRWSRWATWSLQNRGDPRTVDRDSLAADHVLA
jgi:drug/metabolite transporter (DMT)-like permease